MALRCARTRLAASEPEPAARPASATGVPAAAALFQVAIRRSSDHGRGRRRPGPGPAPILRRAASRTRHGPAGPGSRLQCGSAGRWSLSNTPMIMMKTQAVWVPAGPAGRAAAGRRRAGPSAPVTGPCQDWLGSRRGSEPWQPDSLAGSSESRPLMMMIRVQGTDSVTDSVMQPECRARPALLGLSGPGPGRRVKHQCAGRRVSDSVSRLGPGSAAGPARSGLWLPGLADRAARGRRAQSRCRGPRASDSQPAGEAALALSQ